MCAHVCMHRHVHIHSCFYIFVSLLYAVSVTWIYFLPFLCLYMCCKSFGTLVNCASLVKLMLSWRYCIVCKTQFWKTVHRNLDLLSKRLKFKTLNWVTNSNAPLTQPALIMMGKLEILCAIFYLWKKHAGTLYKIFITAYLGEVSIMYFGMVPVEVEQKGFIFFLTISLWNHRKAFCHLKNLTIFEKK